MSNKPVKNVAKDDEGGVDNCYCPSPLCCSGKACCSSCCIGFEKMGVPAKNFPRVAYVFNSVIFMAISVGILFALQYAEKKTDWLACDDYYKTDNSTSSSNSTSSESSDPLSIASL